MKPVGLFVGGAAYLPRLYAPETRARIEALLSPGAAGWQATAEELTAHPGRYAATEVILGAWGMPRLDERVLAAMPNLKAVFYAGSDIPAFGATALFDRGIHVTTARAAHGPPVAEFAIACMVLASKRAFVRERDVRTEGARAYERHPSQALAHGMCGATVGLVSLGVIGRAVAERLRGFDVSVLACDPGATAESASEVGARLVGLDEVFARSDIVSLHAPLTARTRGMIGANLLRLLKPGATLINTARGGLIDEAAMVEFLQARPDVFAVLDVTEPEPPAEGSPLWKLPNVWLTPHIAGAQGGELQRLGRLAAEELERWMGGLAALWPVDRAEWGL